MKKYLVIIAFLCVIMALSASPVGKIRFILGEVQYKETLNQSYKTATINSTIHSDGYLKTGPDATAEVQWNNGSVSIVNANTQISISKLQADANTNPNWKNQMWDKVNNLKLQKNRGAESVAGIRREEAEVKKESQLFWYVDDTPNIDDAITYFDNKEYAKAIPIFEAVINFAPLKREAELSHAYLIMIFDELGDKVKQKKHVELLKADFPDSSTLDSLPPEQ